MFARRLIDQLLTLERCVALCAQVIVSGVAFTSAAIFPNPAAAQSASFRSVDTNRDGVLTFNELVAAFGRDGANRLLNSTDYDGDGRITISELRRGPDDEDRDDDRRPGASNESVDDRDDDGDDGDDGGDDGEDGGDDGGDSDSDGDDGGDDD